MSPKDVGTPKDAITAEFDNETILFKAKVDTLKTKYHQPIPENKKDSSVWQKVNFFASLRKADFSADRYKLYQQYQRQVDQLRVEHNKQQFVSEQQREKTLKQQQFELKQKILANGGIILSNRVPANESATLQTQQWLANMHAQHDKSSHSMGEMIKAATKEETRSELTATQSVLKEGTLDTAITALAGKLSHDGSPPTAFTLALKDASPKTTIGVFQDERGIWLHDPNRVTVCFPFSKKDVATTQKDFIEFLAKYQHEYYGEAAEAILSAVSTQPTLTHEAPKPTEHRKEGIFLSTKVTSADLTPEPTNKAQEKKKPTGPSPLKK